MGGFSSGSRGIFDAQGRIAQPLGQQGTGVAKRVDGRSLLSVLNGGTPPTDPEARDFTYAGYSFDTNTMMSRKGYYVNNVCTTGDCSGATKVCGYLASVTEKVCDTTDSSTQGHDCTTNADCGSGACNTDRVVRTVRGGSCTACGGNGAVCTDPSVGTDLQRSCTILGGVCMKNDKSPGSTFDKCTTTDISSASDCPITQLRRCVADKDCPKLTDGTKLICIDDPIIVPCTNCFEAAWKYRASGNPQRGRTRLTDLMTNPEENIGSSDPSLTLDCFDKAATSASECPADSNSVTDPICLVQFDLADRLDAWKRCENHPGACDSEPCEDLTSVPSCVP